MLHNGNTSLTPNEADNDYQFPKQQACKRKFQSQSNPKLGTNRYESLRDYISERNDDVIVTKVRHLPPEEHASEKTVKTSDSRKQNDQKKAHERDEYKQKNKTLKKFPVAVILGDSLVKDTKGWTLCDESNKVANQIMQSRKYRFSLRHSANEISNGIIEVALLCKSDTNNVSVSGILTRTDYNFMRKRLK